MSQWNNSDDVYPYATCLFEDEYFLVSDGKEISLAKWINLSSHYPDHGYDQDEYDFKILDNYLDIKYWIGPIFPPQKSQEEISWIEQELKKIKEWI